MKITTNKKRKVSASRRIPNASTRRPYKKRIMASGYRYRKAVTSPSRPVDEKYITKEFVNTVNDPYLRNAYERSDLAVILVENKDLRIVADGPNRDSIQRRAENAARKYYSQYDIFDISNYSIAPRSDSYNRVNSSRVVKSKHRLTVNATQDRYNRTLKNPGPNKVNVQPYRGDYAVVVGLENGGYAYNTYLTEFTAKNEAETFRHYVQKFGADETADQWEFQKVEACDNYVTASIASHRYEVALDQGENEPLAVKFFDDYNEAIKWADTLHDRGGAVRITDNETGEVEELGDFQSYWDGKEDVTSCDNSVTASRIDVDNFDNTYEPDEFSRDPEGMGYEENKAVALVSEILDEYQSRTPTKLDPSIVDECYAYAHDYERSPGELADIVYSILDEAYPELVEACDCVNASVYTNPGTNKTPVESNVEYYQALADGVVALLDKHLNDGDVYNIRAEVTPEAITFLDGDNNIYWIQSGKDIIPNWDDLQDDIDELYGVVYMNAIPGF